MSYNFDHCPERKGTDSVKWRQYDEDVLPLWVADMDFVSPEPVIRALQERVAHGVFGYPVSAGIHFIKGKIPLVELLVERMMTRYGWRIQPEDVVFIPGVVTGLNLACHAFGAGGSVLVQPPIYPPFLAAPREAGATRQENSLIRLADGTYEIDFDAFEAAIKPNTRLFLLCNPHNPVGRVFRREELSRLAEICLRHKVTVCSDEIHSDLVFSGHRHIPFASLDSEITQNTVTLLAPSKTFNIAGLECSIAIIQNPELRSAYRHAQKGLVGWVNLMGWVAAEAAYRDGQEWLDQLLVYLEANREFLLDFVARELPGVTMARPEGTYLAWLDCRASGIPGNPYEFFLEKARVALNDGATFGSGGEGFVRLNFGCPRGTLTEALERMRSVIQ